MTSGVGSVHVKKQRGKATVIAYGQTPRGLKYPKAEVKLQESEKDVNKFKEEMAAAVTKLLG